MKAKIKAHSWPLTHICESFKIVKITRLNKSGQNVFELKTYSHHIEKEEDGICELCKQEDAVRNPEKSSTTFEGGVEEKKYMVTKTEKCRKFLEIRFEGL